MTNEQLTAAFDDYAEIYGDYGPPKRIDPQQWGSNVLEEEKYQHVLWMCEEGKKHVEAGKVKKAMRWLGFIQGVLWCNGDRTIADLKDTNR